MAMMAMTTSNSIKVNASCGNGRVRRNNSAFDFSPLINCRSVGKTVEFAGSVTSGGDEVNWGVYPTDHRAHCRRKPTAGKSSAKIEPQAYRRVVGQGRESPPNPFA